MRVLQRNPFYNFGVWREDSCSEPSRGRDAKPARRQAHRIMYYAMSMI
jgi:hypothetical protein